MKRIELRADDCKRLLVVAEGKFAEWLATDEKLNGAAGDQVLAWRRIVHRLQMADKR